MKNYKNSDYALNKHSDGIVYGFADGSMLTITLGDYLAENPGMTEDDFRELKELSDSIYLQQDRDWNAQNKRNKSIHSIHESVLPNVASPEEIMISWIDEQEEAENQGQRLRAAYDALDMLTETQQRRYLAYHIDGLSGSEIAEREGTTQQAISKSLCLAETKIKIFVKSS